MPLTEADFPYEVQVAFFIYSLLPDVWDTMNGMWMGKNWSRIGYLLDLYKVENQQDIIMFIKHYETCKIDIEIERVNRENNKSNKNFEIPKVE